MNKEKLSPNQWLMVTECMREACEKTVELCAENADVDEYRLVDKESILKTKNQIV